ncbi:hypothetical protein SAY87_001026 [Trapa incisa]|uniref:Uncharacterized protein n=1 Tax=Trapa incisa TaxID=236973 RepID=A0AAN7GHX2_9MYRT|nr:hypothetical protein SAY87_001026 [Trapa incisa]
MPISPGRSHGDKKSLTFTFFLSCFRMPEHPVGTRSSDTGAGDEKKPKKPPSLPLPSYWFKKPSAKTVLVASAAIDVDVNSVKAEARWRYEESMSMLTDKSKVSRRSKSLHGLTCSTRSKLEAKMRRSRSLEKLAGSKRVDNEEAAAAQDKNGEMRIEVIDEENPQSKQRSEYPKPQLQDSVSSPGGSSGIRRSNQKLSSSVQRTRPRPMTRPASFPGPPYKGWRQSEDRVSRDLDPVIGLSIIMVAMTIIVLWGRLCAVLCTCAWFYLICLLRPTARVHINEGSGPEANQVHTYKDEYKKKVVLEGLLERSRRR